MPTDERRRRAQWRAADYSVTRLRLHEIIAVGECASGHPGGATSERAAVRDFGQRGTSFIQAYMSVSTASPPRPVATSTTYQRMRQP